MHLTAAPGSGCEEESTHSFKIKAESEKEGCCFEGIGGGARRRMERGAAGWSVYKYVGWMYPVRDRNKSRKNMCVAVQQV